MAATALRRTLHALRTVPDAAADATFECGTDLLCKAADANPREAPGLLTAARRHMASAEGAEEARDDAALYGAGIDALIAFARLDRAALETAPDAVRGLLDRRESLLLRSHQPAGAAGDGTRSWRGAAWCSSSTARPVGCGNPCGCPSGRRWRRSSTRTPWTAAPIRFQSTPARPDSRL